MAFSHATARTARRPRRGPGPGFCFPTWATPAGPHVVSHPSSSNGHTLNPAEQNRRQRPRTLASSFVLPCSLHLASQRASDRGCLPMSDPARGEKTGSRRRLEPLIGACAHRWVDAPSLSGLTVASLRARAHRDGKRRLRRGLHAIRSSTSGAPMRS
jgi:hypothetical protein